jgi:hypothetical protein
MHETTAYDEAVDEGRIKTAHLGLLNVGRRLFGEPTKKTETTLTSILDADRLDRMLARIAELKSWKALVAVK